MINERNIRRSETYSHVWQSSQNNRHEMLRMKIAPVIARVKTKQMVVRREESLAVAEPELAAQPLPTRSKDPFKIEAPETRSRPRREPTTSSLFEVCSIVTTRSHCLRLSPFTKCPMASGQVHFLIFTLEATFLQERSLRQMQGKVSST